MMSDYTWVSYWEMGLVWDIFRSYDENEARLLILSGRHSKLAIWKMHDRLALAVRVK